MGTKTGSMQQVDGENEQVGRYEIIRPLAKGGMAEIFLARQAGPAGFGKTVVVKRVLAHLATDEDFIEMFLDEARLAAFLSHPNVVQVFDFGEDSGSYYLAMEYLAGEDLSAVFQQAKARGRPIDPQTACLICSHALEGLHYAHTLTGEDGEPLKIVHRDISPSNIMVTYQGSVKLLDFGIAKAAGKMVRTQVGTLKGKYMYMSPEQARGRPVDGRSDLFALGAVLYEMLTGVRLFQRDNQLATLMAVAEEPIPSPKRHRPDLPDEVEEIVMRALERDPAGRFSSGQTMREAIDEYLAKCAYAAANAQLRQFLLDLFGREHISQRARPPTTSPGVRKAKDGVRSGAAKAGKSPDAAPEFAEEPPSPSDEPPTPKPDPRSEDAVDETGEAEEEPTRLTSRPFFNDEPEGVEEGATDGVPQVASGEPEAPPEEDQDLDEWGQSTGPLEDDEDLEEPAGGGGGLKKIVAGAAGAVLIGVGAFLVLDGYFDGLIGEQDIPVAEEEAVEPPVSPDPVEPREEGEPEEAETVSSEELENDEPESLEADEPDAPVKAAPEPASPERVPKPVTPAKPVSEPEKSAPAQEPGRQEEVAAPEVDPEPQPAEPEEPEVEEPADEQEVASAEADEPEEPAEAVSPEPAQQRGKLMVNCVPWCRIYLNGRDTQRTSPARDIRLPAGSHELRVVHPPTGMERFEDIVIEPGDETVIVVRF